jgi:hypothetical protein
MFYFPRAAFILMSGAAIALSPGWAQAQSAPDHEQPAPPDSHPTPHDAIARLVKRVSGAEIKLQGSDLEILRTVLRGLNVPIESQLLVFSKTSLQGRLVRPGNPRALYFSDSEYVGWVPGGLIEAVAMDPELGPVFYSFDPQDARDARRTFVRETSCLRCHGGTVASDAPRLLARSVFPADDGEPLLQSGLDNVDDETPFEQRWGGWYVTGYAGRQSHRGNGFGVEHGDQLVFHPTAKRPTELSGYLETSRYLAATSDVVALSIFEHQLGMYNSLTRAAQNSRRVLNDQRSREESAPHARTDEPADESTNRVLANAAEDVLDHLLFRNAAPLPAGLKGGSRFQTAFATGARRDSRGDALKDLSLRGRLFANRCSFLIYSESFNALPVPLKVRIFDRLFAVLQDNDAEGRYAYLEKDEKRRIFAVLIETLPDARRYFSERAK